MSSTQILANPFALMMNPEEVFEALQGSGRLDGLQRRVYRPLDKPLISRVPADAAGHDDAIDEEPDSDE